MRILTISSAFPFPPDNGTKIQIYHRIRWLSEKCHMTLLCIHNDTIPGAHIKELEKYCALKLIRIAHPRKPETILHKIIAFFRSVTDRTPYYIRDNISGPAKLWIQQKIKQGAFDLIEADGEVGAYFDNGWKVPKILIKHSILYTSRMKELKYRRNPIDLITALPYWWLSWSYEKKLNKTADLCVTLTKKDEYELKKLNPGIPVLNCLTNGIDLDYFDFKLPKERPSGICFVGRMDYSPNIDAVLFFYHEILPLIKEVKKDMVFYIVGSSPSQVIMNLNHDKHVHVTGYVQDVRPYLRKAGIAVVPIRMGGGILNKILEALAMGIPVVTCSNAIDGLRITSGEELLLADTPAEITQGIIRLFKEENLRQKLALKGRLYVEQNHVWKTIVYNYYNTLRQAGYLRYTDTSRSQDGGERI